MQPVELNLYSAVPCNEIKRAISQQHCNDVAKERHAVQCSVVYFDNVAISAVVRR